MECVYPLPPLSLSVQRNIIKICFVDIFTYRGACMYVAIHVSWRVLFLYYNSTFSVWKFMNRSGNLGVEHILTVL